MKTAEYLELVKTRHGLTSDYQLAKRLQVPTATVSNWRSGTSNPSTFLCFRLAEMLQLPAHQVVADIELERAERTGQSDQVEAWRRWVDRLGSVAASVLAAVILSATGFPGNASAGAGLGHFGVDSQNDHRRGRKRRRKGAAQAFATVADTLTKNKTRAAVC